MVSADLERLVSPHDQSGAAILLVLEESDLTGSTLLPLPAVAIEAEQLGAHLECGLLGLLVGLGVDSLGKVNDRLKVYVDLLLGVCSFFVALDISPPVSAPIQKLCVCCWHGVYLALLLHSLGTSAWLIGTLVGLFLLLFLWATAKHAEDVVFDSSGGRACGIGSLLGDCLLLGRLDLLGGLGVGDVGHGCCRSGRLLYSRRCPRDDVSVDDGDDDARQKMTMRSELCCLLPIAQQACGQTRLTTSNHVYGQRAATYCICNKGGENKVTR